MTQSPEPTHHEQILRWAQASVYEATWKATTMSTQEPAVSPFGLIAFRAHRMSVSAEVAYWAESEVAREHHAWELIRRFDEIAPLVAELREAVKTT